MPLIERAAALANELGDERTVAQARANLAHLAGQNNEIARATELAQQAQQLFHGLGDIANSAGTVNLHGELLLLSGDHAGAEEHFLAAKRMYETAGLADDLGIVLNNLGELARIRRDYAAALAIYSEVMGLAQRFNQRLLIEASALNLGFTATALGQFDAAAAHLAAALTGAVETEHRPGAIVIITAIGCWLSAQGRWHDAAEIFGACAAITAHMPVQIGGPDAEVYDASLAAVRASLDPADLDHAWQRGAGHDFEALLDRSFELLGQTASA